MNAEDDKRLDEMLARSYEPLRVPPLRQREAILAALAAPRPAVRARQRRAWNGPLAWLATAACLVVAAVALALLVPSSAQMVYGIEAVPRRLAEVQTIRQRGVALIYDERKPDAPPVRVPIEYLVKRPDKFRLTWYGVSRRHDAPPFIKRGVSSCDGQTESWIYREEKLAVTRPVGPVDAWIKTETHAQEFLAGLLGPPEVPYRKVGREAVGGRTCDVYEGEFGRHGTSLRTLWIDPRTGDPVRSTSDERLPDGSRRRVVQIDEIALDEPLDDKRFEFAPPTGFRVKHEAALPANAGALDDKYTSASYGGDEKIELWHAFEITDHAALVVWRRSQPKENADGTLDWLAGLTITLAGDKNRPLVHDWVYQSHSPDVWNWSLVALWERPFPDRASVLLWLKSEQLDARMGIVPLRFPEKGLAIIIPAAAKATLPADGPQFTLDDLRRLAGQLTDRQPKPSAVPRD
jgi:outer membrane lipoprotein-sorting protein